MNVFAALSLLWELRLLLLQVFNVHEDQLDASWTRAKVQPIYSADALNHTVFNICLFPPLFFFYGLYYTDVWSALLVLTTYRLHLRQSRKSVVLAGLASLLLRQTNIFWVAVFLGGLQAIRRLKRGRRGIEFPKSATFFEVARGSVQHSYLYDPLLSEAYAEGILKPIQSYLNP